MGCCRKDGSEHLGWSSATLGPRLLEPANRGCQRWIFWKRRKTLDAFSKKRGQAPVFDSVFSSFFKNIFRKWNALSLYFYTLYTPIYTSKTPSVYAVTLIHSTLQRTRYVYTLKSQYFSSLDYFFRGEKCIGDFYAASCVLPLMHTSSTRACISSERHTVTKDPQSLVNKQDRQNWC